MPSVVMPSNVMLSAIMMIIFMLSVIAPKRLLEITKLRVCGEVSLSFKTF